MLTRSLATLALLVVVASPAPAQKKFKITKIETA